MEAQHPFAVVPTAEQPLCPQEKAPCSQSICHAFNDAHLAQSWNSIMAQLLQDIDMRVHQHGQELKRLIGCHLQVATSSEDVNRHDLQLVSGIEAVVATAKVIPPPEEERAATEIVAPIPGSLHRRKSEPPPPKRSTRAITKYVAPEEKHIAAEKAKKPWRVCRVEECLFDNAREKAFKNQSWLQRMTRSQYYEWASGALILCNAVFIGFQTEFAAQQAQGSGLRGDREPITEPVIIIISSAVFTFLFAIELLARWISEGIVGFFGTGDVGWCVFDVFIVALSIVDTVAELSALSQRGTQHASFLGSISMLRVLRVMRVVKLARVIRLMSFFRELRLMIYCIMGSLKSLLWVTMVLGVTFYIFAITFTSGAFTYVDAVRLWTDPASEGLRDSFGTLGRSFLTLYMAMAGGRSWGEYYVFLTDVPVQYRLLFLTFLTFNIFAVFNIVTGVFVDSAMQVTSNTRQVIIQQEMDSKKQFLKDLRDLFHEMDEDGNGHITAAEFSNRLNNERVIAYFKALKLDVTDTYTLFHLLDTDESQEVDVLEFLAGCYHLQGEARSIDTKIIRMQLQWIIDALEAVRRESIKPHTASLPGSESPQ